MKLYQIVILFLVVIGLSIYCSIPPADGSVPVSAKAAFKVKYPEVKDKNVTWEKDEHGYHEAQFEINGEKYRADFADTGKWIETEASIKYKHLPKSVQDAIEESYDKDDIVEIEEVDHHEKGIFYDVEIDEKGKKKFDIEYNALGKIIGGEGLGITPAAAVGGH